MKNIIVQVKDSENTQFKMNAMAQGTTMANILREYINQFNIQHNNNGHKPPNNKQPDDGLLEL